MTDEALYFLVFGMIVGIFVGVIAGYAVHEDSQPVNKTEITVETAGPLPDARSYCQQAGFDWGQYSGSKGITGDTLSITCFPETEGSWTTYYFDLNLTRIDTEVTTTQ